MLLISISLALIFILLINYFPTCMVYTTIAAVCLFFLILAIVCFSYGGFGAGIIFLIILLSYIIVIFCCFRKHIPTAIVLSKVSAHFVVSYPTIYLLPILMNIFIFLFVIYWVAAIIGIAQMISTKTIS